MAAGLPVRVASLAVRPPKSHSQWLQAAKVTRKTSSAWKGVISTSKPPRFSTCAQRDWSARRENTMRFGGAGSLAVAFKRSSQLPSAWSRSQSSTGTLWSRNNAKAPQQSEASCSSQFPWERISRSRTRSAGKGLTARARAVHSGDGIDFSDRPLIDFSARCAISNVSLRYRPAELDKCLVLVRERDARYWPCR